MNISIREYKEEDKETVVKLFENLVDFLISIDPTKRLRKLPKYGYITLQKTLEDVSKQDGVFYVAVANNTIVGFIAVILPGYSEYEAFAVYPVKRGRIIELYVDSAYREKGVGTKLMQAAEKYLKDKGCEFIRLVVLVPNVNAHNFYKKLGFEDLHSDMFKRV